MSLQSERKKDVNTIRFANKMFNTSRLGFLHLDTFEGNAHTHIGAAVNIFLRHQLLDQLLDSVNYPPNEHRVDVPSISVGPTITTSLQGVRSSFSHSLDAYSKAQLLNKLVDWSAPIKKFQDTAGILSDASLISGMSALAVTQYGEILIPPHSSDEATMFHAQLTALSRAAAHTESASAHNVLANLEYAGFASGWYARPDWGELEDVSSIKRVMQ
jgi:hypothetical protein